MRDVHNRNAFMQAPTGAKTEILRNLLVAPVEPRSRGRSAEQGSASKESTMMAYPGCLNISIGPVKHKQTDQK